MRIVHLNPTDSIGGAARATHRLHTALRRLGHDSTLFVLVRLLEEQGILALRPDAGRVARLQRRVRRWRVTRDFAAYRRTRPAGLWMYSDDRAEHGADVARQMPPCDVLNLHAMDGRFDYRRLFRALPGALPVVWRLPEMQPFTGGCHLDGGCGRFASACGACPQLGSSDARDLSHQIWRRKRAAFAALRGRLHVVATSRWIAGQCARSSLMAEFPITIIPNGLDVNEWAPRDRQSTRHALGIPPGAKVVLFAAADVRNRVKGYAHLLEALRGLGDVEALFLLTVGYGQPEVPQTVPSLHLGKVASDRIMQIAYSAADVYVMASVQESFGQTVTEAMACGTPVVAFAVGGMLDTVRPGVTGLLAETGSAADLREAIRHVLCDDDARSRLAEASRRVAVEEYSSALQAQRYAKLYEAHAAHVARLAGRAG